MKAYILGACLLGFVFWSFTNHTPSERIAGTTVTDKYMKSPAEITPVLVELFTSQGCSSCPSADAVLQQLAQEAQQGESPAIVLSYHVDYWNRLGWTDPYSDAAYSRRQRNYASRLADQGVYTPQIVVQGQSGHVGSREREVRTAIAAASRKAFPVTINVRADDGKLFYQLEGELENTVLQVAFAEMALENTVPRGENRGRQLAHTNVVRELQTIEQPADSGEVVIGKDVFSVAENGKVILFVQNKTSWQVLGVVEVNGI